MGALFLTKCYHKVTRKLAWCLIWNPTSKRCCVQVFSSRYKNCRLSLPIFCMFSYRFSFLWSSHLNSPVFDRLMKFCGCSSLWQIPLQALQTDTSNTVESNPNPILVSALVIFFSYSSPHISSTLMSQIDISRVISGAEGSEDSCKN